MNGDEWIGRGYYSSPFTPIPHSSDMPWDIKHVELNLHFVLLVVERLYSYGTNAGDSLATATSTLTGEKVTPIIPVPHGLPFADGVLLNGVYVSIWRPKKALFCTKCIRIAHLYNLRLPGTYGAKINEKQTPMHISLNDNSVTSRPSLKIEVVSLTKWPKWANIMHISNIFKTKTSDILNFIFVMCVICFN